MLAFVAASASWQPPRCGVPRARPDLVLRTAPVLALLDGQKPILPTEFTQAVPDMGQARLPLSPTLPDPRAKIPGARELPPCTVVVVGANGRVGSRVVTELLRKHSKVNVRALVRSASPNPDPNPNPHPNPNPNPNPNPHPNHYPNPNPNPSPKPKPKPKPNPSPSPNPNPNQVRDVCFFLGTNVEPEVLG